MAAKQNATTYQHFSFQIRQDAMLCGGCDEERGGGWLTMKCGPWPVGGGCVVRYGHSAVPWGCDLKPESHVTSTPTNGVHQSASAENCIKTYSLPLQEV